MTQRLIRSVIQAQMVSDGAGVKIRRSLGLQQHLRLDPFLMLDCFGSDEASDYIAGFPPHPHRGFETVTYMLAGHMLHEDHLGNRGHLKSGGVQWMTAGRGIIHSEMPQQQSGLMQGFQLWLNLPAAEKMKAAAYVDLEPSQIPKVTDGDFVELQATEQTRLLILAAKPIGEPIVQYGPFVMNTVAEIEQAIRDYQTGKLTDGAASTLKFN